MRAARSGERNSWRNCRTWINDPERLGSTMKNATTTGKYRALRDHRLSAGG